MDGKLAETVLLSAQRVLTATPRAEFAAHCEEHENIQQRLNRTGLRTYGARYTEPEPAKGKHESSTSGQPQQRAENERVLQHRPKAVPAQVSTSDSASTTEDIHTDALSKRVQAIVKRFPAYQGDGIEPQQEQRPREIPCPDCDAKFRSQYVTPCYLNTLSIKFCLSPRSNKGIGSNLTRTSYHCTAVETIFSSMVWLRTGTIKLALMWLPLAIAADIVIVPSPVVISWRRYGCLSTTIYMARCFSAGNATLRFRLWLRKRSMNSHVNLTQPAAVHDQVTNNGRD